MFYISYAFRLWLYAWLLVSSVLKKERIIVYAHSPKITRPFHHPRSFKHERKHWIAAPYAQAHLPSSFRPPALCYPQAYSTSVLKYTRMLRSAPLKLLRKDRIFCKTTRVPILIRSTPRRSVAGVKNVYVLQLWLAIPKSL